MEAGLLKTGRFTRDERVKRSKDIKNYLEKENDTLLKGVKFLFCKIILIKIELFLHFLGVMVVPLIETDQSDLIVNHIVN